MLRLVRFRAGPSVMCRSDIHGAGACALKKSRRPCGTRPEIPDISALTAGSGTYRLPTNFDKSVHRSGQLHGFSPIVSPLCSLIDAIPAVRCPSSEVVLHAVVAYTLRRLRPQRHTLRYDLAKPHGHGCRVDCGNAFLVAKLVDLPTVSWPRVSVYNGLMSACLW